MCSVCELFGEHAQSELVPQAVMVVLAVKTTLTLLPLLTGVGANVGVRDVGLHSKVRVWMRVPRLRRMRHSLSHL
jgi:hypothetical protein